MKNSSFSTSAQTIKSRTSELKKATDPELVSMYRNGDNAAFGEIVNRYQAKTMRYLTIQTKDYDVACELFQEVMIKISNYIKSDKYKEIGALSGLISLSAHNKYRDHHRTESSKKENRTEDSSPAFNIVDYGTEEVIERENKLCFIYERVNELPDNQKTVFMMIQSGYKFREVAEKLNIGINTALSQYNYAIKKIRAAAEHYSAVETY